MCSQTCCCTPSGVNECLQVLRQNVPSGNELRGRKNNNTNFRSYSSIKYEHLDKTHSKADVQWKRIQYVIKSGIANVESALVGSCQRNAIFFILLTLVLFRFYHFYDLILIITQEKYASATSSSSSDWDLFVILPVRATLSRLIVAKPLHACGNSIHPRKKRKAQQNELFPLTRRPVFCRSSSSLPHLLLSHRHPDVSRQIFQLCCYCFV